MNKLYWGIFWATVGFLMSIFDAFYKQWFTINFTYFKLPLGILFILYGLLHLIYYFLIKKEMKLSDDELGKYGSKLEIAASEIVDMIKQKIYAKEIAESISKKHNIPQIVTLKYIITLGKEMKKIKKEIKKKRGLN